MPTNPAKTTKLKGGKDRMLIALFLCLFVQENELVVFVEPKDSVTTTHTIQYERTRIGDYAFESPVKESKSNPKERKAVLIIVETKFSAVRVTSATAHLSKIETDKWCTTTPGKHRIDILAAGIVGGEIEFQDKQLDIEIIGNPDDDAPAPDDEPEGKPIIGGPGFRVLIVYESSQTLPSSQRSILGSETLSMYLTNHVAIDNRQPAWRIFDQDTQFNNPNSIWAKAIKRPRTQIPWILISNTKGSYEGPLPANVSETIELLKKYESKK